MSKFNCPHPIKYWHRQIMETPRANGFPGLAPSYPLKYFLDLLVYRCVKDGCGYNYVCTINSKEI